MQRPFASSGRDNNFNLVRALAAVAVMVSHSWPLTLGEGTAEPLQGLTGQTLGTLCLYVFFGVSGFLIAASFARSRSVGRFLLARFLRLFPGLMVSLLLAAFVMGPLVTTLPLHEYLENSETWSFVLRNATLLKLQVLLPGVFEANPYPTVEGSIWTLVHEVGWYGFVLLAGIAGMLNRRWAMLAVLVIAVGLWGIVAVAGIEIHPTLARFQMLGLAFLMGMALWAWRDRVPASGWIVGLLAVPAAIGVNHPAGLPFLMAFVVYATFWFAYVPGGWIRRYNRLGDYSYGIYIYAFPVQGLIAWGFALHSPWASLGLALPITFTLAILSWHLIERPALSILEANAGERRPLRHSGGVKAP